MNKPNIGQIEFIRSGFKQNIRVDGRNNLEMREILIEKGILPQTNGSSYVKTFDSQTNLYVGIKVDIIDKKDGIFNLKIDSMKRRVDKNQDNELLEILKSFLDKLMIHFLDTKKLTIQDSKKSFQINIDVFLIDYVNIAYLDIIAIGIRAALEDLELPEVKVLHNHLTNEDELELIEENLQKFVIDTDFQMPQVYVIGEYENYFVLDMNLDEFFSIDSIYYVSVRKGGEILMLQKDGKGYISPENIFKLFKFIQNKNENFK